MLLFMIISFVFWWSVHSFSYDLHSPTIANIMFQKLHISWFQIKLSLSCMFKKFYAWLPYLLHYCGLEASRSMRRRWVTSQSIWGLHHMPLMSFFYVLDFVRVVSLTLYLWVLIQIVYMLWYIVSYTLFYKSLWFRMKVLILCIFPMFLCYDVLRACTRPLRVKYTVLLLMGEPKVVQNLVFEHKIFE